MDLCIFSPVELTSPKSYFEAGAVAGAVVPFDAGAAPFFAAFLVFFTCFFATGAELSVEAAGAVWAAKPTVARESESAITAEVMVFIVFVRSFS